MAGPGAGAAVGVAGPPAKPMKPFRWRRKSPGASPARLEDAFYAIAQREIESGKLRRAAWKTALRLANGEEHRAVAVYIRLRVRALLAAHEARQP